MSTLRSSLLFRLTIILLAFFSDCEARSVPRNTPKNVPRGSPKTLQAYSVPLSDGSSISLPSPSGTLKAVGVGRGTQNYTCAAASSATPTPIPVSIGATAILLDATPYLKDHPPQEGMTILKQVVEDIIGVNISTSTVEGVPKIEGAPHVPVLGQHYFNGAGQPTFDLSKSNTGFLVAKKIGDIPAPTNACAGQDGQAYGAVDWLTLTDVGGSQGLNEVYRVETAGGKHPTTCSGTVTYPIQIQYAALYWFYD